MITVAAFNGSPRADGNTAAMIRTVFSVLEQQEDIVCEMIHIGGRPVYGCRACGACRRLQDRRCVIDDEMNSHIAKMIEADVVLIGSPTYYATLTPETKALMDRAGTVTRSCGGLLRRKIGAAISPARRAGSINTFSSINNFFLINEMIVPGSSYWNMSVSRDLGDFAQDSEGAKTMETLGRQIAWLAGKLQ